MASSSRYLVALAIVLASSCDLARDLDDVEFVEHSDVGMRADMKIGDTVDMMAAGDVDVTETPDLGTTDVGDNSGSDAAGPIDMSTEMDMWMDMGGEPDMAPPPGLSCAPAALLADVSNPTTVVGDGTAGSCTGQRLQMALDLGGIVTFNCGAAAVIRLADTLVIRDSVTLDGGGNITLSGETAVRVLRLDPSLGTANVRLQNIRIVDGADNDSATPCGAGILQEAGSLSLVDVTLARNQCGGGIGGGLATRDGFSVRLHRVTFDSNAAESGGGIGGKGHDLTISDSTWLRNQASEGGGIWSSGEANLCGVYFEGNTAKSGGAMAIRTNTATDVVEIDQAHIRLNDAMTEGGGLLTAGEGHINVRHSAIVDNTAGNGGGVLAYDGTFKFENVTVARNRATEGSGGGVLVASASGQIMSSTIVDNDAVNTVGGLLVEGAVEIGNTIIGGNSANQNANCTAPFRSTGGNVQYPNPSAGDAKCTDTVLVEDPLLSQSADGTHYVPSSSSMTATYGVSCPADDQIGTARPSQGCASGSIEP